MIASQPINETVARVAYVVNPRNHVIELWRLADRMGTIYDPDNIAPTVAELERLLAIAEAEIARVPDMRAKPAAEAAGESQTLWDRLRTDEAAAADALEAVAWSEFAKASLAFHDGPTFETGHKLVSAYTEFCRAFLGPDYDIGPLVRDMAIKIAESAVT